MMTLPRISARHSLSIALASAVLAGCSQQPTTADSSEHSGGYTVINSRTESDVYNATASASAHTPVYVAGDSSDTMTREQPLADNREAPSNEEVNGNTTADPVIPVGTTVHFAFDSSNLSSAAKSKLTQLAANLDAANPQKVTVQLAGHTDSIGSEAYNDQLSKQRAEAVREFLQTGELEISVSWDIETYGEDRPIASNDTDSGREQNRRVHIEVVTDRGEEQFSSASL